MDHRDDGTDDVDSETITKDGLLVWDAKARYSSQRLSVTCVPVDVIIARLMDHFRHRDHGIATAIVYRPTSSLCSLRSD